MTVRPLPARVAGALICLWVALVSVGLPVVGCAHVGRPLEVADPAAARGLGLVAVPEGSQVRVWLRDGRAEQGDYRGVGRLTPAAYATRYDAWRTRFPAAGWPALGESVQVTSVFGGTRAGVFEGFDWGTLRMRAGADVERVRFEDLRTLSGASGATFSSDTLARLRDAGRLPLASTLRLATSSGRLAAPVLEIPLDQVKSLEVRQGDQWATGAILGAAAGVVIVMVIIGSAVNDVSCTPR